MPRDSSTDDDENDLLVKMNDEYGLNGVAAFALLRLGEGTVYDIERWLNRKIIGNVSLRDRLKRSEHFKSQDLQRPFRDIVKKNGDLKLDAIETQYRRKTWYKVKDVNQLFQCLAETKLEKPRRQINNEVNIMRDILNEYYKISFPIGGENPFFAVNNGGLLETIAKEIITEAKSHICIFACTGGHMVEDLLPLLEEKCKNEDINCRVIATVSPKVKKQCKAINVDVKGLKRYFDGEEIDGKSPSYPLRFIINERKGILFQREFEKGLKWATEIRMPVGVHILTFYNWIFNELWDSEKYTE